MSKVISATGSLARNSSGGAFRPKKGRKTRSQIYNGAKDKVTDLSKKMKDQAIDLLHTAKELQDMASHKMKDLTLSAKAQTDGQKKLA